MKLCENITTDEERAFYNLQDAIVKNCLFSGKADGESALKESKHIEVENCRFLLRYPMWHCTDLKLENSFMGEGCRAGIWYTNKATILNTEMRGVKALRECSEINLKKCKAFSEEFGWRCNTVNIDNCDLTSPYIFFESDNVNITDSKINGKYSFQYNRDLTIKNSVLDTKDAFWHTQNAVIENCEIKGEYLGWYSDSLTLINCSVSGTQPLCYCKNLKLINCTMTDCDLSFEYSDLNAEIKGKIDSVKNPKSGIIKADKIGEIITENSVFDCNCKIETKE